MKNFSSIELNKNLLLMLSVLTWKNPIDMKNKREIIILGTVVRVIYLMWLKRFEFAIAEAKLVVSLSGDNLSPKYAPEIIAPATIPVLISMAFPIPTKAIPMVADVVQLLPVEIDIIAQIITHAGKKNKGWKIWSP